MIGFYDKVIKYLNKIRRDGFIKATRKAVIRVYGDYISILNPYTIIKYNIHKKKLEKYVDELLENHQFERVLLWRSSIGWEIPLFQRPQHLSDFLSQKNCLVLYEVTKATDNVDFIVKKQENLYLINYDNWLFIKMLEKKLAKINKNKYQFIASTTWDLKLKKIKQKIDKGYNLIYDYLDELSSTLSGTNSLPHNVKEIYQYVVEHQDVFVICTADILYQDMLEKRGSKKNVVFACNGVSYEHFSKLDQNINFTNDFNELLINKRPLIGYYGALAEWFDYDLIKTLAKELKDCDIVLIGVKYDLSFDANEIKNIENIHYLGSKKFNELPYYASHFDVCILPFLLNDVTKATSPIKIFEYMALDKPIVTTDLQECRKYQSVKIGKTHKEFIGLVREMLQPINKSYRAILKKEALENTWESKVITIIQGLTELENH
jgi:Glycosyltransferase